MSERKKKWRVHIYKGEERYLVIPQIRHAGNYYICSDEFMVLDASCAGQDVAKAIIEMGKSTLNSPLSSKKSDELVLPWKLNLKYKTQNSFWKNNFLTYFYCFDDGEIELYSAEKVCRGGYGGCIKKIELSANASEEVIGRAIIEVFEAAEEYYKLNKK